MRSQRAVYTRVDLADLRAGVARLPPLVPHCVPNTRFPKNRGPRAVGKPDQSRGPALVGETGFEPATPWSRTRCSTRLSHSPKALYPPKGRTEVTGSAGRVNPRFQYCGLRPPPVAGETPAPPRAGARLLPPCAAGILRRRDDARPRSLRLLSRTRRCGLRLAWAEGGRRGDEPRRARAPALVRPAARRRQGPAGGPRARAGAGVRGHPPLAALPGTGRRNRRAPRRDDAAAGWLPPHPARDRLRARGRRCHPLHARRRAAAARFRHLAPLPALRRRTVAGPGARG